METRRAELAGSWYPGTASECELAINGFLSEHPDTANISHRPLVAGVVPHAGWYFSGSLACNTIRRLSQGGIPDVLVVFGMHLHPRSPAYIMKTGSWETPFGDIAISEPMARLLCENFPFTEETATSHIRDNTIELQLPFIKYFFRDVKIIPMGVPPASTSLEIGRKVVEIASRLNIKLKVIGSTDLTHYGPNYDFLPKGSGEKAVSWVKNENDRGIIETMVKMDPAGVLKEGLSNQSACCAGAAAATIEAAKALGSEEAETIGYSNSFDKGPGDSFVGYTGIVF
jgi:MEMO1 family protein